MTKRSTSRRSKKLNRNAKIGIATLTTTALIGGWNAIGHLEATTSQALAADAPVAIELLTPTATLFIPPTPIVLPTIPALEIAPIASLAPASDGLLLAATGASDAAVAPVQAINIQPLAALAPLPTMAPLPDLPSMPAPPPPSSSSSSNSSGGGGDGAGKSSGGS